MPQSQPPVSRTVVKPRSSMARSRDAGARGEQRQRHRLQEADVDLAVHDVHMAVDQARHQRAPAAVDRPSALSALDRLVRHLADRVAFDEQLIAAAQLAVLGLEQLEILEEDGFGIISAVQSSLEPDLCATWERRAVQSSLNIRLVLTSAREAPLRLRNETARRVRGEGGSLMRLPARTTDSPKRTALAPVFGEPGEGASLLSTGLMTRRSARSCRPCRPA